MTSASDSSGIRPTHLPVRRAPFNSSRRRGPHSCGAVRHSRLRGPDRGRARSRGRAHAALGRRDRVALRSRGAAPKLPVRRMPGPARTGPRDRAEPPLTARLDGARRRARRRLGPDDPLERRSLHRDLRLEHAARLAVARRRVAAAQALTRSLHRKRWWTSARTI